MRLYKDIAMFTIARFEERVHAGIHSARSSHPWRHAIEDDADKYFGYVRAVARVRQGAQLDEVIQTVPTKYTAQSLLR